MSSLGNHFLDYTKALEISSAVPPQSSCACVGCVATDALISEMASFEPNYLHPLGARGPGRLRPWELGQGPGGPGAGGAIDPGAHDARRPVWIGLP